MSEYSAVVRQRDELRIRIQHLLHLLQDSQTAFDDKTRENQVLRHALSQGIQGAQEGNTAVTSATNIGQTTIPNVHVHL